MQAKLRRATLMGGYLRRFIETFPESPTIVAFSRNNNLMGWAFALCHGKTVTLNLYVLNQYRNQGVATHLVEEALKYFPRITLGRWNENTKCLFHELRAKHPSQIRVIDWWENRYKYDKLLESARSKH